MMPSVRVLGSSMPRASARVGARPPSWAWPKTVGIADFGHRKVLRAHDLQNGHVLRLVIAHQQCVITPAVGHQYRAGKAVFDHMGVGEKIALFRKNDAGAHGGAQFLVRQDRHHRGVDPFKHLAGREGLPMIRLHGEAGLTAGGARDAGEGRAAVQGAVVPLRRAGKIPRRPRRPAADGPVDARHRQHARQAQGKYRQTALPAARPAAGQILNPGIADRAARRLCLRRNALRRGEILRAVEPGLARCLLAPQLRLAQIHGALAAPVPLLLVLLHATLLTLSWSR